MLHCLVTRRGIFVFFFFSSRRRHTRSLCDWSSDVCSSDLLAVVGTGLNFVVILLLMATVLGVVLIVVV